MCDWLSLHLKWVSTDKVRNNRRLSSSLQAEASSVFSSDYVHLCFFLLRQTCWQRIIDLRPLKIQHTLHRAVSGDTFINYLSQVFWQTCGFSGYWLCVLLQTPFVFVSSDHSDWRSHRELIILIFFWTVNSKCVSFKSHISRTCDAELELSQKRT